MFPLLTKHTIQLSAKTVGNCCRLDMALVKFIRSSRAQSTGGLWGTLDYCCRRSKTEYEGRQLVSGINCVPKSAYREFMNTKELYGKKDGRMFYQMLQSFSPDENLTPETAHEIAIRFAQEQFPGYEVVVATHTDTNHIHSHFVINSVSMDTGLKYHSNMESLQELRNASDELCREYGLSIIQPKNKRTPGMSDREYRVADKGQSWKLDLAITIDKAMEMASSREHFIRLMEWEGYEVKWTADRKNITYTTPAGNRCRDSKLHDTKYRKDEMEYEFSIRAALRRRNERAPEADDWQGRKRHAHRGSDGTQLASDDRFPEVTGKYSGGHFDQAGFPGYEAGAGGLSESAAGNLVERELGYESQHGAVPGSDADPGGGNGNEVDGSNLESRSTGWEAAREIWQRTLAGAGTDGQAYREAVLDQSDPQFDFAPLGSDAAHLAAHLSQLIDGDSDDPEERRKKMQAQQAGSDLGTILGLAIGAVVVSHEHSQEAPQEENIEASWEQKLE